MSTDSTIELHVGDEVVVIGCGHDGYDGEILAVEPGGIYLVQLARYQLRFAHDELRPAQVVDDGGPCCIAVVTSGGRDHVPGCRS